LSIGTLSKADLLRSLAADGLVGDRLVAEMALGQLVHAVAVAGAVEDVGEQHGVVEGRDGHVVFDQHTHVVFEVVADLQHSRIDQHRAQALEDQGHGELARLLLAEIVDVADRHIDRAVALDGEREADELGPGDIEGRGLGVDREQARGPGILDQGVELGKLGDRGIDRGVRSGLLGRRGPGRGRGVGHLLDPADQRLEVVLLQKGVQPGPVDVAPHRTVDLDRQRRVVAQRHQFLGEPRLIREVDERLAALGLLDARGLIQELLERAVFLQELGCGLDPDAGHARHVVRAVAGQARQSWTSSGPTPKRSSTCSGRFPSTSSGPT
jgi:hypothetical protein